MAEPQCCKTNDNRTYARGGHRADKTHDKGQFEAAKDRIPRRSGQDRHRIGAYRNEPCDARIE